MKARSPSILARILVLHITAVGATSLALVGAIYLLLNSVLLQIENRTLHQHEAAIAAALKPTRTSWTLDLSQRLRASYAQHLGGFDFVILNSAGQIIYASITPPHPLLPFRPSLVPRFSQRRSRDALYVAAQYPVRRAGTTVYLQVAQDLGDPDAIADDTVAAFFHKVLWLLIVVLLALLLVDVLIIRSALRPVVEASRRAESIAPARFGVRLPTSSLPLEVRPLATAVNSALDRLEHGFALQRAFTADAAHELRTPLSILKMRIETLCDPATAHLLQLDLNVMARIVSQLLAMAELESKVVDPTRPTDLAEVCEKVAGYLAPLAAAQGKAVAVRSPEEPVWIIGDEDLLFQTVRNLVENGIYHGPVGQAVQIEVSASGSFTVRDNGPGIPEHDRSLVFQRFWRGDRQHSKGAGLGLSIVAQIVELHGGSIYLRSALGGGAEFEVRLIRNAALNEMDNPAISGATDVTGERSFVQPPPRATNGSQPKQDV
jgi:signal transduction histidine kinase